MKSTLVLGLGNTLLGDEGVGVHVVERLAAEGDRPGVIWMDGGTLSFTLAGPIAEADRLIVIDAANLQEQSGAVRQFVNGEMDHFIGTGKMSSVHEVSLLDLLSITALSEKLPSPRALIGIQPEQVDWSEQLTPAVESAVDEAVIAVKQLLEAWEDEQSGSD
ncbi:MAG: HyaD/HybD family hydrogenase maturation endopeptidase [Gammaproteobacteria bacterium]|jgi:hydrogenase maturation protease|nr:HyaD/HybD family hydrogenase maturation endopeptidase [Gammaproteobacteria bacterium]MBT7308672.1 HyaD/HybD family hydrogenase maturation endopeptidase [Gammaproteobacteria bacterium]